MQDEYGLEVRRFVECARKQMAAGGALDICELEYKLRQAALVDASSVLSGLLFEMAEHTPHCRCGDAMQSQGQRTKGLVSLLGEGTLRRGYYECDVCKSHAHPKDELLHVKDTSFTPGIRRVVSKLASLESFEDASEDISNSQNVIARQKTAGSAI